VTAFCCAIIKDPKIVIASAFMTAGIVIALTLYAFFTKTDFTTCGGIFAALLAELAMLGLFCFTFGPTMRLLYCGVGVITFGTYLVIDTQQMCGGKRS
jgi:FtsH-binding integral membrane protein